MKPDEFIGYLDDPLKLNPVSVSVLDEIVKEYPFCQPAQLLFLKGLQNDESLRFNRQLRVAAAYASDRKVLFEMLNSNNEIKTGIDVGDESQKPVDPKINPSPHETPGSEKVSIDLVREVEGFVPITDIDLLPFDFPAASFDNLPEIPAQNRAPDLDRELLQQFLETDPLSRRKNPEPMVRSMGTVTSSFKPETPPLRNKPDAELIDRFIGNKQSKVLRPDQAPINDNDFSINSIREDDEFLTDTLARIYVQQGYFLKAIQAYEKLSLKIPEKSIYFASQIEMVRELIKNQ